MCHFLLLHSTDTCATNFMIRDSKMIQLVAPEKEPITPFVRLVRSLYDDMGISSVMVIGGTGDFFDVADTVLVMDSYHCLDATERAKQIVVSSTSSSSTPNKASQGSVYRKTNRRRILNGSIFTPNGKVRTSSQSSVSYADTEINLSAMEQLVSKSQTVAIVNVLQRLPSVCMDGQSIWETLKEVDRRMDIQGLDSLSPGQCHGGMSRPRLLEIAGAINRLRRNGSIFQQR
jgi:predicted ABC-class ATPase